MLLRNIAIVGQTLAIIVVHELFAVPLPLIALISLTGVLVLLNLAATFWRLQRPSPVTDLEVLAQIVVDIGALTALLYLSGGATNPFVGMFLMPLTIAAARLPWTYTLTVALLTLACYSLLIFFYVPLPVASHGAQGFLVFGMWVNYLLCAGLIAYLVLTVASRLREQNRSLVAARRSALDREYLVRVGSLAAGAAHEIRSPLCTMAILIKDMLQRRDNRQTLQRDLRIMADQIEACRRTLSDLVTDGQDVAGIGSNESADKFLHDVVDRFRGLRPGIKLSFRWSGAQPPVMISAERDLGHAILNLLNNAADASPGAVEMNCSWNAGELRIHVEDRGPGIPSELGDMLGERFLTTKGDKGTGIGLLLAKTAIRRAGGNLRLSNRPGGGARAEVVLPLEQTASIPDRTATRHLTKVAVQVSKR
jgi:two-component system sensor histidine kinase RegB